MFRQLKTTHLQLGRYVAARMERWKLGRTLPVSPLSAQFMGLVHDRAVWQIAVPAQGTRFMSVKLCGNTTNTYIVHVGGDAFYAAWLTSSGGAARADACPVRSDMTRDRKFHWATRGFSHGLANPVPVALATAHRHGRRTRVGFVDGMTRTLWLLAHRAPSFPIAIQGQESAELLHAQAGLREPMTVGEIFWRAQQTA